jgi:hypothetical protein
MCDTVLDAGMFSTGRAGAYLGVRAKTSQRWDRRARKSKRRRYAKMVLGPFMQSSASAGRKGASRNCRVVEPAQKPDLKSLSVRC